MAYEFFNLNLLCYPPGFCLIARSATHVETMLFKDETAFFGCLFCSHVGDAFKLLSNAGEYALQSLDWQDGSLSAVHPATLIDKQQQVQKLA